MAPQNKMAPFLGGEGNEGTLRAEFPAERKVHFFLSPSSSLFKTNLLIQEEQVSEVSRFLKVKIFMAELFLKARTAQLFRFIIPRHPAWAGMVL